MQIVDDTGKPIAQVARGLVTTEESAVQKRMKRQNAELKRANAIPRGALGLLRAWTVRHEALSVEGAVRDRPRWVAVAG